MMIKQPIATAATAYDSALDLDSVAMSLLAKLEDQPDLIIASYSSLCDATELINHLRKQFPDCAIAGASTCRGALTETGLCSFGEANVALWGLSDKDGSYGVGFSAFDDVQDRASVKQATQCALDQALSQSGRDGELPSMIWMHASPGNEEAIVATLDEIYDGDVSFVFL